MIHCRMTFILNIIPFIQGDSVARGPKLLSIKNYVIEIMTWKFMYTYRERCKTGPVHNRYWNWPPFTSKHTWMCFSKFWSTFTKVSTFGASSYRITLYNEGNKRTKYVSSWFRIGLRILNEHLRAFTHCKNPPFVGPCPSRVLSEEGSRSSFQKYFKVT